MWAALSFLMHKSVASGVPSLVTRWSGPVDMKPRLLEMLALFEPHPTASVLVTDGKPTTSMWQDCWAGHRWPSVVHWTPPVQRRHRIIAHQFDGRSSSERKNPPVPDLASFNSWLAHSGAVGIHLGLPLSMRECATWMALADLFVGSIAERHGPSRAQRWRSGPSRGVRARSALVAWRQPHHTAQGHGRIPGEPSMIYNPWNSRPGRSNGPRTCSCCTAPTRPAPRSTCIPRPACARSTPRSWPSWIRPSPPGSCSPANRPPLSLVDSMCGRLPTFPRAWSGTRVAPIPKSRTISPPPVPRTTSNHRPRICPGTWPPYAPRGSIRSRNGAGISPSPSRHQHHVRTARSASAICSGPSHIAHCVAHADVPAGV